MENVVNFGKYEGQEWKEVPIEYIVWLLQQINNDISEGKVHDSPKKEILEYWLEQRHQEVDDWDRKNEWKLENEKKAPCIETQSHMCEEESYDEIENIAKMIIGIYGEEKSLDIAYQVTLKAHA